MLVFKHTFSELATFKVLQNSLYMCFFDVFVSLVLHFMHLLSFLGLPNSSFYFFYFIIFNSSFYKQHLKNQFSNAFMRPMSRLHIFPWIFQFLSLLSSFLFSKLLSLKSSSFFYYFFINLVLQASFFSSALLGEGSNSCHLLCAFMSEGQL